MKSNLILLIVLSVITMSNIVAKDNNEIKDIRTFISLLDYIGTDYYNSVKNGKVINSNEYMEMNEFINRSIDLFNNVSYKINPIERINISRELKKLKSYIENKSSEDKVFNVASNIKSAILKLDLIETAPTNWPDIQNGENLFQVNCSSCHGTNGNGEGILAKTLNPKPANFLSDTLMEKISPFKIYNTIKLGISGTSMAPFDKLSDKEIWDLAFYVSSLRYKSKYKLKENELEGLYNKALSNTSLEEISTLSDKLLLAKIGENNKSDTLNLAALRLYNVKTDKKLSINKTFIYLDDVLNLYKKNEYDKAEDKSLSAYLEGIEPFEQQLQVINSELKSDVEAVMYKLRADIKNREPFEVIQNDVVLARTLISDADSAMKNKDYSFGFAFILAASIILREGIEAFLIIITILGVLKSINESRAVKWVHGGWLFALVIGIASMFFINLIVSFNAQSRELMEGFGSLFAVILLLYVGFWLHSKTEANKWKEFVEDKIIKLVSNNNLIGLAVISFVVVFREAFESAIFLSAIELQVEQSAKSGIYFGAVSSLILVLLLAWIVLKFAVKLPIMKLFKYSAFIIVILSIVLAGKGIQAFQESGYISITQIPIKLNFPLVGFYPTVETTIAQLFVLLFTIVLWKFNKKFSSHHQ
ncbi:MAG: c-type cytochrome [Chlorobi bacterium]|nr:c-type cytochrome [Chlorobiota bacterium]